MRKNKKLLLGGLSVLTLVAAGSGAVSTFAWWSVGSATATAGVKTGETTFTVTEQTHAADDVAIPMLVTVATTADQSKLVLAHYNSSATTANKMLSSGYLDEGGGFHEETNAANFKAGGIFYGDVVIKIKINFGIVASSGVAGWAGKAGEAAYNVSTNPYGYDALPEFWQTAAGVQYEADDLLALLAADTVDVGIKQDSTLNRGRLFERYAMTGDVNYAYFNETADVSKTAVASGDLEGYYLTKSGFALSEDDGDGNYNETGEYNVSMSEITVDLGHDLYFYAFGGATNADDTGNNVSVKFEAKIA